MRSFIHGVLLISNFLVVMALIIDAAEPDSGKEMTWSLYLTILYDQ